MVNVDVHNYVNIQVTTVFAADAVARLSGVVGVAAVTAGPGKRPNNIIFLFINIFCSKGKSGVICEVCL